MNPGPEGSGEKPKQLPETPTELTPQDIAYLEKTFRYHPPKGDQPARYVTIREAARMLATTIIEFCPQSRERSLALTQLEQAVFWANASIARNE